MPLSRTLFRCTAFGAALPLAGCPNTGSFQEGSASRPAPNDSAEARPGPTSLPARRVRKAGDIYEAVADDTRNARGRRKARFYQAECLSRQGYYPKAVDAYNKLLQDFPSGRTAQAAGRCTRSRAWLQPVREEIEDGPSRPRNAQEELDG